MDKKDKLVNDFAFAHDHTSSVNEAPCLENECGDESEPELAYGHECSSEQSSEQSSEHKYERSFGRHYEQDYQRAYEHEREYEHEHEHEPVPTSQSLRAKAAVQHTHGVMGFALNASKDRPGNLNPGWTQELGQAMEQALTQEHAQTWDQAWPEKERESHSITLQTTTFKLKLKTSVTAQRNQGLIISTVCLIRKSCYSINFLA